MRLLYRFYLLITDVLVQPWILKLLGVREARIRGFMDQDWKHAPRATSGTRCTWFHASSTGELEILIPLIQEAIQKGFPIGISVFSDSALPLLRKNSEGALYAGLSPRESDWDPLVHHFDVHRVIVSKYESWPGLWATCVKENIALIMINAQYRRSLKWVRRFMIWFGFGLPNALFTCMDAEEKIKIKNEFPKARVEIFSDPRWKRAKDRAQLAKQNPEVNALRSLAESGTYPHPHLVAGSAWIEDLEILLPAFKKTPGTLWVVPHSLERENVARMKARLEAELPSRYVLVDRMGILLEFYSLAERVWVGGGFGKGIHSTLEPAVFQVPIACGPRNVERFLETRELRATGLLTVCRNSDDVSAWLGLGTGTPSFSAAMKGSDFEALAETCFRFI